MLHQDTRPPASSSAESSAIVSALIILTSALSSMGIALSQHNIDGGMHGASRLLREVLKSLRFLALHAINIADQQ